MRDLIRAGIVLVAGCAALACGKSKTEQPVVTTTEAGKSTSPSGAAADQRGTTLIRVVNAMPGSQKIDLAADDRVLFTGIGFQDVSDFSELKDNVTRFAVRPAGRDSVLADNREVMGDGARYTLVALPDGKGGTQLRVLRDELATDSAKTKIRVINATAGVNNLNVTVLGQKDALFDAVSPGVEAGYQEIAPATATLFFKSEKGAPLARLDSVKLAAGHAYTIVVTGKGKKIETVQFDDRLVRSGSQVTQRP